MAEAGGGSECAKARLEMDLFDGDGAAHRGNFGVHFDGFVSEDFAARFPAGRENFPREKAGAWSEMNFCALLVANAGKGNDRVGEIFEECVFGQGDFGGLDCGGGFAARAIDARGAGGGELRGGTGANVDGEAEAVTTEKTAGNVVEMN